MLLRIGEINIYSARVRTYLFHHKIFVHLIKYFGIDRLILTNKAQKHLGDLADGNPFEFHVRANLQPAYGVVEIRNVGLLFRKEIGGSKKDCRSDSNQYRSKNKNAD